jgi:anti-sigma regulatory factor (Ser/Thr protein kinase)
MPFNALQEKDFFGRREELAGLYNAALQADSGAAQSRVLSGPRGIGKTELLKQLFGLLFWKQDRVAPFYYAVNPALLSIPAFSKTYLIRFLCQRLAFEKKEQALFYHEGMSLDGLSALIKDRDISWAQELLEHYQQNAADPLSALRIALAAPHRSTLMSGVPVVVLLDEFHRLQDLVSEGTPDARLVSLFEEPMSYRKTPHVVSGNTVEILELPVSSCLERVLLRPLMSADASAKLHSPLHADEGGRTCPPLLLQRLAGNPFYLGCVGRAVNSGKQTGDTAFWSAYVREVTEGAISIFWSSIMKHAFPDLSLRKFALAVCHKIYHSPDALSCRQLATAFTLTDSQAESIAHKLYLAGFIRGAFGAFRAAEDGVLRDIIDCQHKKEVLAKSSHDIEAELVSALHPDRTELARFDLTLPMLKDAELVAAQCLEQVGKNQRLDQEIVGQMQIAVIEACINTIEHSRGGEQKIYVSVVVDGSRLEASIESAGHEFIVLETGEPFSSRDAMKTTGRGWGIKLMKRFADEVRFEKTARGMKTVLVKYLNKTKTVGVQLEDTKTRE